ncbi:hypothetical protein HYQ46_006841 [Verticillium longisporum]|nr:hypothetical protein HYQ46_006841 [Verticillium longisporum]
MFLNQDDLDDDMGGDFDDLVEQDNEADHELPDSADEGRDDPELTNDADEGTTTLDANDLDLTVDAADDVAALQESGQIVPLETDTLTSVTAVDEADINATRRTCHHGCITGRGDRTECTSSQRRLQPLARCRSKQQWSE